MSYEIITDHRAHIYLRPSLYVGSIDKDLREESVFDIENMKMVKRNLTLPNACEQLFIEIINNACDNVIRSRKADVDPRHIEIKIDPRTISVLNYGLPIPVEKHPNYDMYIPQLVFSELQTSSSYNMLNRALMGVGAKVINIFSKEFMVIIHDGIRHLKYTQVWNDNMTRCSDPIIEDYPETLSSVQVVYTMDFERFGYNQYSAEDIALFAKHAAHRAYLTKTAVIFNKHEFRFDNIKDFSSLFFDNIEEAITHEQEDLEVLIIPTPDNGQQISFVNMVLTSNGGVHVNDVINKTAKKMKRKVNDIKSNYSFVINYNANCPHFSSQSKNSLIGPAPIINKNFSSLFKG